ncbi:hypothetical protein FHW36_101805 [Chitinophaga polysaccharea]|uniref:Uncharacterized protein n=1 Tax=Chitinophaga polysaccharea TaxID=1293035 RepID=A0A561Q3H0_9BACT|nr:hypothetical protein FHW36_101805 [Chitinophaga polysaccharea]
MFVFCNHFEFLKVNMILSQKVSIVIHIEMGVLLWRY